MQAEAIVTQTLTSDAINDIVNQLNEYGANDESLRQLKQDWPQFRFILCSEDDMGAKEPYMETDSVQLHLIAASLGCASLTREPENAVGLVIAVIEPED
ncbi:hypothetical protein [Reinekea thalattae]|uniref:Uncharacterized protein n=1 Tax=Reinekea thalattae TaxID=2593301 RepID=A0A5C8Z882_9GAMM|nr:hypothetical protein [Reinekea thalattae]TXR53056.1 hypothetical protein FME95_00295 [Reinekea thalattae]